MPIRDSTMTALLSCQAQTLRSQVMNDLQYALMSLRKLTEFYGAFPPREVPPVVRQLPGRLHRLDVKLCEVIRGVRDLREGGD
jgi:predicted site-specific integrase-resolvase